MRSPLNVRVPGRAALAVVASLSYVLAACAAPTPPAPTTAPAKPADTGAKPSAAASPSGSPSASPPAAGAASPSAAGAAAVDPAAWEKETFEAAKKDGKVTVYGFWNPTLEKMVRDFMAEKYPGVELETLTSPTAPDKIRTERQAGQFLVDVYLGGQTTPLTLNDMGVTEAFKPPAENAAGSKWVVPPSSYTSYPQVVYGLQGKGILINTTLVPPDKEPKNWNDLLDPYWKGKKIIMDHPGRGGGPGSSWARWMFDQSDFGQSYLEKLKAQEPVLDSGSAAPQINSTARGEYFALLPAYPSYLQQVPGAPVKFIWPEPGTGGGTTSLVALIKDAPHPAAARLFMNMTLLPEFQKRISELQWISPNLQSVPVPDPVVSLEGRKVAVDTESEIKRTTDWVNQTGRAIFGQ